MEILFIPLLGHYPHDHHAGTQRAINAENPITDYERVAISFKKSPFIPHFNHSTEFMYYVSCYASESHKVGRLLTVGIYFVALASIKVVVGLCFKI